MVLVRVRRRRRPCGLSSVGRRRDARRHPTREEIERWLGIPHAPLARPPSPSPRQICAVRMPALCART
jgi:hypothetical protein